MLAYRIGVHEMVNKIKDDRSLKRIYELAEYLYIKEDPEIGLKQVDNMDHKGLIIKTVQKIENPEILASIYSFIKGILSRT